MKRLILWIAALVMLQGGALFGQSLVGTWQGPLQVSQTPGDTLRVVFKISTTALGTLYGDMYSIDQGGHAAAPDVTLKGSAVKIAMPSIGATYLGKLSGDGNSITGSWTGANGGLRHNLTRPTAETAWEIPQPPPPPRMMPADADPAFEVATVKLSNPDQRVMALRMQGRQFSSINLPTSDLILFAYGIHPRQLLGAPDWIEEERYDVLGKPDVEGQPNNRQIRALIQKLLADRFSLKFHREQWELSVYLIVVGKTGAKLTKAEGDSKADPLLFFYGPAKVVAKNTTMVDFAGFLQTGTLDRPVVDQTGLTGRYDFGLLWKPELPLGGPGNNTQPPSDSDGLPDIYVRLEGLSTMVIGCCPEKASSRLSTEYFLLNSTGESMPTLAAGARGNGGKFGGIGMIDGLPAEAYSQTVMVPPGGVQLAFEPIVFPVESWYSPTLKVTLLYKFSDSRDGETKIRVTNIKQGEPAASLFQVPAGYRTINEEGDFTIVYSEP